MPRIRNLFGLTVAELARSLEPFGARPFTARQVASHLYARGVRSFDQMTDLPTSLRATLERSFTIGLPLPSRAFASADGTTRYVLSLPGGGSVEAVFIPARARSTLCISSQVGCGLGCAFCMTGTLGLRRNLAAGEIAGQVGLLMDLHDLPINKFNIVLMGMGEPLQNFGALAGAMRLLCEQGTGFGISPNHITVSTAGLAPQIERLAGEDIVPRLAVSLNATTDRVRSRIMPVNRAWPIRRLMQACRMFVREAGRRLTLEYVMLGNLNDSPLDAARLARLAASIPARVNLIPFNAAEGLPFQPSPPERVRSFRERLLAGSVHVSVRRSRGADARAACGQLAFGEAGGSVSCG